ncbi:MAG: hypothetical protein IIC28_07615 [Chloroflexi bacterium]|nr:hypothetical protein [Chloroflexota bacterium]
MRGLGSGRMAEFGRGSAISEYVKDANRETLVCVQIEEVAADDNLDEILGVPDIDVFFIGPTDLARSTGHPGDNGHPDVKKVVQEVFDRIHAAGKASGPRALPNRRLRTPRQASCITTPTFQRS